MTTTNTTYPFPFSGTPTPAAAPNALQRLSGITSNNTGLWTSGVTVQVCTTGTALNPANTQPFVAEKLLVFDTDREINKHRFLLAWLKADAMAMFENRTGYRYKEIVIMKMGYVSSSHFRKAAEEVITEVLPTMLVPGGRIINLNDLQEGEDEPQRLGGQTDTSEPDAS